MIVYFDKIDSIDYYDGMIRGVGYSGQRCFLIVVFEWHIENNSRRYAVLRIDRPLYNAIVSTFESSGLSLSEKWDKWELLFDRGIENHIGEIYSVVREPIVHTPVSLDEIVDPNLIQGLRQFSLEKITVC